MRITNKDLDNVIDRLNTITNSPKTTYTKNVEGRYKANIGNYHLYGGGGSYSLHRMANENGGVKSVLYGKTKSELYDKIQAYISGILSTKESD